MLTSIAVIESVGGIEVLALLVNCTKSSVAVTCRCDGHGGDGGVKDHNDYVDFCTSLLHSFVICQNGTGVQKMTDMMYVWLIFTALLKVLDRI